MFGHRYDHRTLRRYIAVFGTLFNDVYVVRTNADGDTIGAERVPLTYGPKEKFLARVEQDPDLDRPVSVKLPTMSFELVGIRYNPERKLSTFAEIASPVETNGDVANVVYAPVPYSLSFELSIVAKTYTDGAQIVEQILPFFTPDWTVTVRLLDDPEVNIDVPVIFDGDATPLDSWDGDYSQMRSLTWSLGFTMHGVLFGPVTKQRVIKTAIGQWGWTTGSGETAVLKEIGVRPGLLANGSPTTDADLTVDSDEIDWNDDYGIVVEDRT